MNVRNYAIAPPSEYLKRKHGFAGAIESDVERPKMKLTQDCAHMSAQAELCMPSVQRRIPMFCPDPRGLRQTALGLADRGRLWAVDERPGHARQGYFAVKVSDCMSSLRGPIPTTFLGKTRQCLGHPQSVDRPVTRMENELSNLRSRRRRSPLCYSLRHVARLRFADHIAET